MMKEKRRKLLKIVLIFFVFFQITAPCLATSDEILQSQSEMLNIKEFVSQANQYTKDSFDGLDTGTLLKEAIQGNIDNQTILQKIGKLFGKEITSTLRMVRKYYCHYCDP